MYSIKLWVKSRIHQLQMTSSRSDIFVVPNKVDGVQLGNAIVTDVCNITRIPVVTRTLFVLVLYSLSVCPFSNVVLGSSFGSSGQILCSGRQLLRIRKSGLAIRRPRFQQVPPHSKEPPVPSFMVGLSLAAGRAVRMVKTAEKINAIKLLPTRLEHYFFFAMVLFVLASSPGAGMDNLCEITLAEACGAVTNAVALHELALVVNVISFVAIEDIDRIGIKQINDIAVECLVLVPQLLVDLCTNPSISINGHSLAAAKIIEEADSYYHFDEFHENIADQNYVIIRLGNVGRKHRSLAELKNNLVGDFIRAGNIEPTVTERFARFFSSFGNAVVLSHSFHFSLAHLCVLVMDIFGAVAGCK